MQIGQKLAAKYFRDVVSSIHSMMNGVKVKKSLREYRNLFIQPKGVTMEKVMY
jgi:hypothetical protein